MEWEYKTLFPQQDGQPAILSELNDFGKDGWELVCVFPGQGECYRYYFKRPLDYNE